MAALSVEPQVGPIAAARPRVRQQLGRVIALVAMLDLFTMVLSVPLAVSMKFGVGNWYPAGIQWLTGVPAVDFGWIVPVWFASLFVADSYSRRQFARGADEFKSVLRGSAVAALLVSMLAYLINYDMSRGYYVLAFGLGTGLILAERYAVSRLVARVRRADGLMHRVVAVGSPAEIRHLHESLSRKPELGYEIVGACPPLGTPSTSVPVTVLGSYADVVSACHVSEADTLLVAGGFPSGDLRRVGWDLEGSDVDLIVVPSLLDVAGPRIHSRPVSGLPFLHIEPPQVARALKWRKASFDRVGSALLLVLLAPLFVAIALAIKLESRGPVFYRHRRIGASGHEFGVWKFRSMVVDAERRQEEMVANGGAGALLFKVKNDPRVTRVGTFVRRYSVDELPQLINVLCGQMSLVGPRPQVAAEVASYIDSDHRRLLVRPGMTGLWQVSGRSNLTWDEAVRLDLYYVDNWSMAGDLVILFKTVRAVLTHDGAF